MTNNNHQIRLYRGWIVGWSSSFQETFCRLCTPDVSSDYIVFSTVINCAVCSITLRVMLTHFQLGFFHALAV